MQEQANMRLRWNKSLSKSFSTIQCVWMNSLMHFCTQICNLSGQRKQFSIIFQLFKEVFMSSSASININFAFKHKNAAQKRKNRWG